MAATSRAMPSSDRQSARLGVSLSVISVSSSASASRRSAPGGERRRRARAGPPRRRRCPSSFAEHSMPLRLDAAHRRALDREAAGQHARRRARTAPSCRRRRWARRRRSCSALAAAGVDRAHAQAVGVRDAARRARCARRRRRRTAARRARRPRPRGPAIVSRVAQRPRCRAADRHSVRSQCFGEFHRADPYANWRRKRRSFS